MPVSKLEKAVKLSDVNAHLTLPSRFGDWKMSFERTLIYPQLKSCPVLEMMSVNVNHDTLKLKMGIQSTIFYWKHGFKNSLLEQSFCFSYEFFQPVRFFLCNFF
jgi:hypothetical protein